MSEDRLENIKSDVDTNTRKEYEFVTTLLYDDVFWLIEQAERSQKLEDLVVAFQTELSIKDNAKTRAVNKNKRLEEENGRYRAYLGRLQRATKRYPAEDMAFVVNKITEEALEGEK